jgi:hypothetical protein
MRKVESDYFQIEAQPGQEPELEPEPARDLERATHLHYYYLDYYSWEKGVVRRDCMALDF